MCVYLHRFEGIARRCREKSYVVLPALETMSEDLAEGISEGALPSMPVPTFLDVFK